MVNTALALLYTAVREDMREAQRADTTKPRTPAGEGHRLGLQLPGRPRRCPKPAEEHSHTLNLKRKEPLVRGLLPPGLGFTICGVRVILNNTKALTRMMVLLRRQGGEQERVVRPRET